MSEIEDIGTTDDTVVEDNDTTLRTRVSTPDGYSVEVRERYTTVVRYAEKAIVECGLLKVSTGPHGRVAIDPKGVVIQEI